MKYIDQDRVLKEVPDNEFSVSVIHVLPQCDKLLKKGLHQEYYFLNDRCRLENQRVVLNKSAIPRDLYGKRINVQAMVGVNGSGKSSLLEILYRIVNNLSCLLNRNKRRKAAEKLYYITGLYAEVYYVIDGQLARVSCFGDEVELQKGDDHKVVLMAYDDIFEDEGYVSVANFVTWAKESLFYTIVTNYSMQAFNANDYKNENCFSLKANNGKEESGVWINSLFHKNDGYMTPIVLNPYRDNGIIDMNKEHYLTISRLSSIMIYAKVHQREFMKDYRLNTVLYTFDKDALEKKFCETYHVDEKTYREFRLDNEWGKSVGAAILNAYGNVCHLNFNDEIQKTAAMYIIYKTFAIVNSYPSYENFSELGELRDFTSDAADKSPWLIELLTKTILRDKSHVTLKIRQTLHLIDAIVKGRINTQMLRNESFPYQDYVVPVYGDGFPRNMRNIQEFMPPSFFKIDIILDRFEDDEPVNDSPIRIEQMSAGERQYLYTFSTYIYHILNLLSIQDSHRVKYRRVNLVLDEVEICFHPEYQRRFLNELLGYIKRLNMNRNASFNIMIATHSPFILSDIPQCNILYLESGKVPDTNNYKNPFAANICDILYQSFFLKDGFVGEYARRKVVDIITRLQPNGYFTEKWEEQYCQLMEIIGDPFLKMQLRQLYDERRMRNEKNRDR